MRSDASVYRIDVGAIRETNLDIGVFKPEFWINVRSDLVVGFYDILYIDVHKIIERIEVLLYESLDLEKCW